MAFIGIDLGTTNSLVANKRPHRRVRIFNIKVDTDATSLEEESCFFLPSAVSSVEGQYLIGWEVVNNPEQEERIFSIKRLMGRGYDDKDPKSGFFIRDKIRETWGYKIRKPPKGTGEDIEVKLGDDWLTPQEVSSLILRKLKEIVEQEGENVDGAVITVPAYFNDKQKWATREAARLAGLNVQMILNEPTAAAIAYGMETLGAEPRTVAVYDLGGGTFDISILEIEGTNFRVTAIDGNNWLGGDDFDMEIVKFVHTEVGEIYAKRLKEDQVKKNILKQRAKEAKEILSVELETTIRIGDLVPAGCKTDILLTREKFEQMINPYIDETIELIDSVLREKSMTEDDVDKILLVGGSTRIPLVRRRLAQKFGEEKIAAEINPMQCVAIGAAIMSSWLLDKWECPNHECGIIIEKKDTECPSCGHPYPETIHSTERPYGLRVYDVRKQRFIFDVLIPEYTPYPLKKPKNRIYSIRDVNARIMRFPFFAGEKSGNKFYHDEIEKNTHLGTILILLPKGLSTNDKVEISFNLDNNGILDLGSIFINIGGRPVEKKAIIRRGEEENIANEIGELLEDIPKKVKNSEKREELTERAFELFEELFEIGSILDKQLKEEKISELRKKIKELRIIIYGGDGPGPGPHEPPEPPIITVAKNTIRYSYYVEKEYGWLPFMQEESRRGKIHEVRAELEAKIAKYKMPKELPENDKWEIELLTRQLLVLLSDDALDLLRKIEVAGKIAENESITDLPPIFTDPEKWRGYRFFSAERIFEKRSPSERIEDAGELKAAHTKIIMLLKQGKIKEAEEEYNKISHLVIYYLVEFAKKTVGEI